MSADWKKEALEFIRKNDLEGVKGVIHQATEAVVKQRQTTLEHLLRERVGNLLKKLVQRNYDSLDEVSGAVLFSVRAIQKNLVTRPQHLFHVLQDVFEGLPTAVCRSWFSFMEQNLDKFTEVMEIGNKTSQTKTLVATAIRAFCSLLKRLSRNNDATFSGRILIFLSKIMPLVDPSGVNKSGVINKANITTFSSVPEQQMEIDSSSSTKTEDHIDYQFHNKLWTLIQFLQDPAPLRSEDNWNKMADCMSAVTLAFNCNSKSSSAGSDFPGENFFPKFLTSPQLVALEMTDPFFRKHVLIQILIFLKSLEKSSTKKTEANLSEAKKAFISENYKKVSILLENSPGSNPQSTTAIHNMLEREDNWIEWKREGCLTYEKDAKVLGEGRENVGLYGVEIKTWDSKEPVDMGDNALTSLWHAMDTITEAPKVPTVSSIFAPAIEELNNPITNMDDGSVIDEAIFQWRAFRALSNERYELLNKSNKGLREIIKNDLIQKPNSNGDKKRTRSTMEAESSQIKSETTTSRNVPDGSPPLKKVSRGTSKSKRQ